MTQDFVAHWENVLDNQPDSPEQPLARLMVDLRKIVFSHTETAMSGRNLEIENGDLAAVVLALKNEPGKDIMVYGGANFVSSLISLDLIDEYYIFRNPVAIGVGMTIFSTQKIMKLVSSNTYKSGKTVEKYVPVRTVV